MGSAMKEAMFYDKIGDGKVKCHLCCQYCTISPGKRGICAVRENRDGVLQSLVYGKIVARHVDPIEKKPLFHFFPGSRSYSIATVGCNFRCLHCQNYDISDYPKGHPDIPGIDMSPEEVVRLMNVYLNLQAKVIHQFGGTIDKFVGDEVMAIFEGRGNEINAVRAAIEIQNYCKALNSARASAGEKTISIGIGLNSGEVVMGNMGSEDHMDYTVIGDNINVAARMCGIAQPGTVLISKAIAEAIGDQATLKDMHPVLVKGKDQPIGIAEVVMVKGGARQFMRKVTDASATFTLEGFSDESYNTVIKNISPTGCLLEVSVPVGIGSKLHLSFNLLTLDNITVRATVNHARRQDTAYYIGVRFDNLQEESRNRIILWIHQVNSEIVEGLLL
jgi:hypothetical protein